MRSDALGFFWRDEPPPPRVKKEAAKRTPPERVWERPDYLPGLQEALAFNVPLIDVTQDLVALAAQQDTLIFDSECYPNFFQVAFLSYRTGKVLSLEIYNDETISLSDRCLLAYLLHTFEIVGFNSRDYDMPMLAMYYAGKSTGQLKWMSDQIIQMGERGSDLLKANKVRALRANHVDLKEVAPLSASLKLYGGRIHCPRMQDLPFPPPTVLSPEQRAIVRWYCVNDLVNTAYLRRELREQLELRERMTTEYGLDLRSKSDAQIAEAIIYKEVTTLTGVRAQRLEAQVGQRYRFPVPPGMVFHSREMQWTLEHIRSLDFVVGEIGAVETPPGLKDLVIPINGMQYRMGIGGLHSSEEKVAHLADDRYLIRERDVTSYYPFIILNLGLYPASLGPAFLRVYSAIVQRRLQAKARGDRAVADSLKITINGSFGKLASPYSILYSPDLLFRVTISGQLYLLMLIERLELAGISVVSANTDGIFIKCPRILETTMQRVVAQWEAETGFNTEENDYSALYSRDVNNYIGLKSMGKGIKAKGAYAKPALFKNPTGTICIDAIEALLTSGTAIETTVRGCTDIRKFVTVRTVRDGAVRIFPDGSIDYLGRAIRWYYARGVSSFLVNADSGNKVPKSNGAVPLMQLPRTCPDDVDHDWYIREAEKMLIAMAYEVQSQQTVTI